MEEAACAAPGAIIVGVFTIKSHKSIICCRRIASSPSVAPPRPKATETRYVFIYLSSVVVWPLDTFMD